MSLSAREEKLLRNAPKSSTQLVEFLTEYLNWPLPDSLEPQDVSPLEWSFDELHLDEQEVARLASISQLPKFVDEQKFGVFILEFENGKLPVGAIRRLVNQLVKKKRMRGDVSHQQWQLDDLLFFCQSHDGNADLHVVGFKEVDGKSTLKTISWSTDSTLNRLELIASQNLPGLTWPADAPDKAVSELRDNLLDAFTAGYREGVRSAAVLARKMAEVAKTVRDEVASLYAVETESGPLRELFTEVKTRLDAGMSAQQFADMYAQTMVYGLLTARITHPEDFVPGNVTQVLKFENPFLDALYTRFRGGAEDAIDVDEFGLRDLSDLLARTNVDEILADFGVGEHRDDPVVFFYEEFLQEYDPSQRKELGTYYTPIPIVRFMIRAVDDIIQKEFSLPLGVADPTTWNEYSASRGTPIPDGVEPGARVITVLDPATGTGTFILGWLRQAFANLRAACLDTPTAKADVVESVDAFEISLSSYSVAELKVNLALDAETRSLATPKIRLTDSLEGQRLAGLFGDDPLANEGRLAERAKFEQRHSIVVGNPPYLRLTGGEGGGWITHRSNGTRAIFEDFHEPARANTIFSHQASLFNLYVYFWRLGFWKAFEQSASGPAVVAFITASSWLRGPGFLGMRSLARELADEIIVIDLGGDGYGAQQEVDENVFPIQTPVSIVIAFRRGETDRKTPAPVKYVRSQGSRNEKLEWLDGRLSELDFVDAPTSWTDTFVPATGSAAWKAWPLLTDLIPWQQPGCKWNRTWPVAPSRELLMARWDRLATSDSPDDRKRCFAEGSSGRSISSKVVGLARIADLNGKSPAPRVTRFAHRSFDRQWALADPRLAKTDSPSLWQSQSEKQVFMATLPTAVITSGPAASVCADVPDLHFFNGRGGKDILPMYRDSLLTANVDPALFQSLRSQLGEIAGSTVEWPDLFAYLYAVLAGTRYSDRFATELQTPGPRIPISTNGLHFWEMSRLGRQLLRLQTYGERFNDDAPPGIAVRTSIRWVVVPKSGPAEAKNISFDAASQRLTLGDGVLEGVSNEVWSFAVSGMPVMKKWLGYRTLKGSGKAASSASPLDQIRPSAWHDSWSQELRELVEVLTSTLEIIERGDEILTAILEGELVQADSLPTVASEWRAVPPSKTWWLEESTLF